MEITENAASSEPQATDIRSVEPVSNLSNYTIATITGMELEFYNAAMKGNIDLFKGKVEQIESILSPNRNTILHVHLTNYTESVSETFVEEVLGLCPELLLKTNVKNETILHIAARYGHHKIVKKFIDLAKDPKYGNEVGARERIIRAKNDKKDTALHEAARYAHTEVVKFLIKEESDHSYFGKNVDDETPLYIAVERRHWNVVNMILDNSNSPQYSGPNGRTVLHAAVLHDKEAKAISKLLRIKSSIAKEADENGWVPLHLAAIVGSSKLVELLVREDRSTAYMKDNKGRTALHLAALGQSPLKVMKKIIKYCPDCCELVDEKGSNALHYTMMRKRYFLSEPKKILQDTPSISNMCNEKDDDGNTPLHLLACHAPKKDGYSHHPLLEIQHLRVDTMACNKNGQSVLDVALADMPPGSVYKNIIIRKLQTLGARLGGRVPDKQLREKKQEKRPDDSAVIEKENQEKNYWQEYLDGVVGSLSLVAILIATVTFAAGFTLPGGMIQDGKHEGSPILKYNAPFIAFVIADSLSFVISTSAVVVLFLSSVSRRRGKGDEDETNDVYGSLLEKCTVLTTVALVFMIIAFGTGVYAVLGVSKGFGVVSLLIVLSFFFIVIILIWITIRSASKDKSGYEGPYYEPDPLDTARDIRLSHIL